MPQRSFKVGASREQTSLLPPRIDDYVGPNNPVRAIEAYVAALDLKALAFRHAKCGGGAGQPPYDPADLLKLYLYGYLNQVRSSRRLERETQRNLEVIWLMKGLTPGYRTIAKFRQENAPALKAANRDFVMMAKALDLIGGELVAIDGSFFDGSASKASILTAGKLKKQLAAIDAEIEAYAKSLDEADCAEEEAHAPDDEGEGRGGDAGRAMAALMEKRERCLHDQERLKASGQVQLSRTDPDARLLTKAGQSVAGYNVQIAVDDKQKLIVASEVVNDGNDLNQLSALASAAKEALGAERLKAVADAGYYNGDELEACEKASIEVYVPLSERAGRLARQNRFTHEDFKYDSEADAYRCPAGGVLKRFSGRKLLSGKPYIRYAPRRSVCAACALRKQCLSPKARRREIFRRENEEVIERHRERMKNADDLMRRRKALVEHPFGTIKCRAGYRCFLVRGFKSVRGEWSLMALCYNFTRLLNILGVDRFIAVLAAIARNLRALALVDIAFKPILTPAERQFAKMTR